jgi:hypothetical protein
VLLAAGAGALLLLAVRGAVLRRRRRQEDAFATRDVHIELDRLRSGGDAGG